MFTLPIFFIGFAFTIIFNIIGEDVKGNGSVDPAGVAARVGDVFAGSRVAIVISSDTVTNLNPFS